MLTKQSRLRYQSLAPDLGTIWFWLLCGVIVLHTALLLRVGLHAPATPLIQLLRPLVTAGAVILLIASSRMEHGTQRWSRVWLAVGMACSALFSALKITLDISVERPGMRVLWVLMNVCYIFGIILYLRPRLLRPGSALLVFHGSITVGIAALTILLSTLPVLLPWPWNAQVVAHFQALSFDISSLFAFTFLRMRFGKNLSFFLLMAYHGCLILADAILLVIVWADWPSFQNMAAPTYPLYALQSVLFAFAIYRDARSPEPASVKSERVAWEEVFIWVIVPTLVFSAFFAASLNGGVPHWSLVALFVSAILYAILCLNDYWRITRNIYLVSLARLKATLVPRRPPDG